MARELQPTRKCTNVQISYLISLAGCWACVLWEFSWVSSSPAVFCALLFFFFLLPGFRPAGLPLLFIFHTGNNKYRLWWKKYLCKRYRCSYYIYYVYSKSNYTILFFTCIVYNNNNKNINFNKNIYKNKVKVIIYIHYFVYTA